MKTDRELLELAARAAGKHVLREGDKWPSEKVGWFWNDVGSKRGLFDRSSSALLRWNPLDDDGDAFRLALRLKINIEHMETLSRVPFGINCWPVGRGDCGSNHVGEAAMADYPAAARRAIVEAAAAIGEAM